jgi:hypothetical protein
VADKDHKFYILCKYICVNHYFIHRTFTQHMFLSVCGVLCISVGIRDTLVSKRTHGFAFIELIEIQRKTLIR